MLTNQDVQAASEALERIVNIAHNAGLMKGVTLNSPPEEREGDHLDTEEEVFKEFAEEPALITAPLTIANMRRAASEGQRGKFTEVVKVIAMMANSTFL